MPVTPAAIAAAFNCEGELVNRVSIVAEKVSTDGAGPVRSVNTPTIWGRRFGSAKPLRSCVPVSGSVRPLIEAKVPAVDDESCSC